MEKTQAIQALQELNMKDVFNAYVARASTENPLVYVNEMYKSIHPGAIRAAVEEAKTLVEAESNATAKKHIKNAEQAEVYLTLGGESLTENFYTGVVATLLWIPKYIKECASRCGVSATDAEKCIEVMKKCQLPQVHDVKEEVIEGNKVSVEPANVRFYSAFLSAIISWCNNGVSDFKIQGNMKTNYELSRYLAASALNSFPSVPFGCYHVGSCQTDDIFKFSEKIGSSFDFTKYMTDLCYQINSPKFVVTTPNAPIVSIVGHPLAETFVAEIKDGNAKWLGLFIESDEFARVAAQNGLTVNQIKTYIIGHSKKQHAEELAKKNPVAVFIDKNKITKECFELRHKFVETGADNAIDDYDL